MPLDDANWNGGEGGEPEARRWQHTLELPSVAGVTMVHMRCGLYMVEFLLDDSLPKGTIITVAIKEPAPIAVVSYVLPSEDKAHTRMRVLTVPLR